MKALGTGIGGFALTDVEVRRTTGKGATRNAPYLVLHGTAAELADARRRRRLPPLADPHRRRRHRLRRRGAGPVRAVLTRDEMRAADAAALERASRTRPWWPAPAPPWPMPRCACSAAPTAGASSWWRARGATVRTAVWPPSSWPGGGPGCACWRRTAPEPGPGRRCRPAISSIDGAYGTGFRGSYDAPGAPAGARGPRHRHPLGRRRRHGGGSGRGRAGRPDGDVRCAQARPAPGRRGRLQRRRRGGRHRDRVPHTAGPADGGRRRAAAFRRGRARSTSGRPRSAWPPVRPAWRARPSCAPAPPWPPARA